MFSGEGGGDCLTLQITGPDLVRGARNHLLGMQNALSDQASDHVMAYVKQLGGFRHRQPLAILFGGTICMDTMVAPHGTYALCIPRHTLPCTHTHAVE